MPTYITHWKCEATEWPTERSELIRTWNEMLSEGRDDLEVGTVKFAGWISIEYEANPDNPTADIRACLDVFRAAVRKLK